MRRVDSTNSYYPLSLKDYIDVTFNQTEVEFLYHIDCNNGYSFQLVFVTQDERSYHSNTWRNVFYGSEFKSV